MPLQSPPFWWIDDNTGFARGYNAKSKGKPQVSKI